MSNNNNVKKTNFGLFIAQFIFNLIVSITALILLTKVIDFVVSGFKAISKASSVEKATKAAGKATNSLLSLISGGTLIALVICILSLVVLIILSLITLFYVNNHSEMKGLVISNGVIGLIGGLIIFGTITSFIAVYKIKMKNK